MKNEPAVELNGGESIAMSIRNSEPPYNLWPATGHAPFEVHGERFAVTSLPGLLDFNCWRVSHVETGTAIPNSIGDTIEEARDKGKAVLEKVGAEKIKASVAAIKAKIATAQP